MSITSDFWKAMNQSGAKVSNSGSSSKKSSGGSSSKISGGSYSDDIAPITTKKKKKKSVAEEFWEAMGDDDIAPVSSVASRIQARTNGGRIYEGRLRTFEAPDNVSRLRTFEAPIYSKTSPTVTDDKKDENKKKERKWFQKGLFEDGYDFGDVSRTILGSTTDVLENLGSGIIGMGEKAVDAMAYIAPFAENAQFYQNGGGYNLELQKQHEKAVEQSKKDLGKFISKDLYDEEKVAKAIISDPARMIGIDAEKDSVFGEKSDALIQSGGQLLATAGLSAAGMPWWAVTGATSFGSEAENAMNQGATYEEAGASAAISAGAEILSEKLSGGISFGGKTLDDSLTKMLARGISNKLGRTTAKLGLDMAGEGAEEVFSQVASNLGSSLYKEEDITDLLFSEEAMDEYLESFIGGAVLGGVSGGFKAVKSDSKGVDYTSGLTENEQKVVDKLYQEEITNREQEGKVTQKEKSKIYDSILEDMEKGYISTDTIEEVLGGETYKAYKDTVDSEDAILKEYDELGEKPNATPKDYARYTELTEQVKNIHNNSQRNALRAKLNEDVMGLVNGSRLAESYNERARTGQKFEADVTKYDAKQQAVVQKAIDSGILNNSNRTHEFVDFVSKISADTGVLFDFSNTAKIREAGFAVEGQTVDGFITKDGITVNIDSPKSRQFVVGHEITHALEGTELYDALRQSVFDYAKMKNQYGVRMESIQKRYKEGTDFEAELTADLVGEYIFSDTDFINNLSTQNRNVFQKVYDEIKYLCKVATAGSKEARELEKVKRAFEKAYREGGKTQGETKYSISEIVDQNQKSYGVGVHLDSTLLDNLAPDERKAMVKERIKELGGEVFTAYDSNGKSVYITIAKPSASFKNQNGKRRPVNKDLTTKYIGNEVKQEAVVLIDELIATSKFQGTDPAKHTHGWLDNNGQNDWDVWTTYIQDKNNTIWEATLHIANTANGEKIIYDVDPTKKVGQSGNSDTSLLKDNITQSSDNVKYSLSDSDGKQLTKEQQDYFKDSKVRDENGSLKVVYHGTPNGDFTVFRDGTYFTDSKEYADRYQNPGASSISTGKVASAPKTFEVYLDIKKLFDLSDAEARNIYINDYIKGGNAMGINPYLSDAEYAKINSIDWTEGEDLREFLIENEYDYDGLVLDEGATGGYGDEVKSRGKSYVVFSPEQVKNIDNLKPSSDPDIRFSLSDTVEETKDLLAVHNLTSEQVLKSIELGGLPMPSIAVLKADNVHDEYGDVSLILPKESIDPKANRANKVYGGDAWTPVYPRIEYKPSEKVEKKISDKYYGLAREIGYDAVRPMYNYVTDLERQLNNAGGESAMLEKLYDDTDMMNLYLQDSGKGKVEPIQKETVTKITEAEASMNQYFIDALGKDVIESVWCPKGVHPAEHRKAFMAQNKTAIEDAYKRFCMEEFNFTEEEAENVLVNTSQRDLITFVRNAARYIRNNGVTVKTEIDRQATEKAIRNAAADGYKEWVNGLFKGVEEKTGIRNNQDYYTRSGNPRSWDALHWANTLENVVKVMKGQEETGTGSMSPYNSFASLAHKRYGSIAEIKADSNRLGKISQEEYEALGESFGNRFAGIAESIKDPAERNPFIALDNAAETIVEAVRTQKTKAGMLNYLQKWNKRVTKQTVDDVVALVNDIANMPTGYFEAKPQRAVSFDEVGVFVIPYDADVKLKQELLNKGYSIAEYDPKVEGDRQRVVNQFEEYKFSLSNVGEQHTPDSLSALRLETNEVSSDVAPVDDNLSATVSETESVREMFPDDGVNEQEELDNLISEEAELRGVMEAYAGVGDIEAVNKLIPEHEAIQARIKELQRNETDRADSLTDADAPMEMDAPISMNSENYDPWADTTVHDISRSTRSYSDRNPGARHFLEEAALGFGYDVNNSTHGEKWYNDQLYYDTGGEKGFGGTKRVTTSDIAELKDAYGYTWDELLKAADDVAKGEIRSVAAKRVEYLCHKRLMEGYTDVDGRRYEPNQQYITFLNESFVNENRAGSFDNLLENADQYAPTEDIAPVIKAPLKPPSKLKDSFTGDAPIFEGKDGQTTMFEPEKRITGGKTANVMTNEPKTPKRRNKFWSLVKEHVLDNGMVFEDLSKETGNRKIEAKWNFIRYSQSRAQRLIGNGSDGVKALKDIKKTVDKSGKTGQFYDYLYHKHNVDRMSLEDRFENTPNKAVFGDSVTSEMSQRKVNQYERSNPEFVQWADDVYGYMNHLRGLLVENGVISQETADLWEKMYPHYVPIRRAGQDGININVPLDSRKTTVNNPVKRATGGNQDILPLFDTMAQRTIQTYKAIARNSFGIELKNQLGTVIDTNAPTVDDVIDGIDTDDALLKPGERGMNPTFTVFEDGERVEFEITEEMYEAMKPKSEAMQYRNRILNTASGVFRGLTTQYSIPFMATNAIKDAQDVLINSQHPAKTYANFPRSWWQQATNGKWYQEYIENGGEDNTYFDNETNVFKEDSGLMKAVKFPLNAISAANNFIELTPRLSEYIASREAGRSIEVAMLDAARVTTNFAAGGDVTKFLNGNGATFLNASVQGAIQQARNIREAHHKGLMGYVGLATKFALAGLPSVLLNNMLWDDDEDYEELADYVKQDYYVIGKYDDGKFIRIPKGRTVAVIQNAIEQIQNVATGDDEADLGAFLTLAVNNLAPNNPIENNILAPIMQVAKNRTWYGEELIPSRLQDLPAAEQFDEKTDNFSKWLGEQLDISPYKINYLLNQYSGGIGDVVLPMMTPRAENGDDSMLGAFTAPLRDKFTTDSVINSQVVSDFYDTQDVLKVNANSSYATEEDYFKNLYMTTVGYELSDLYKQKREIQNSDMPDSEKYEKSRELQEQIVEGMKNALASYDDIHIDGKYATVGDKRYDYSDYKEKWYEIEGEYLEKEQKAVNRYGITPSEYWNDTDLYYWADRYFDDKYADNDRELIAKTVFGGKRFAPYAAELGQIKGEDKDGDGKTDSGSKKDNIIDYINGLDIDYGERIIMYRTLYSSKSDKEDYNQDIIDYLNGRDDISYTDMEMILKELDFEVDSEGNITW